MQSPQPPSEKTSVPPQVSVVEVSDPIKSPSDTISQLSRGSAGQGGSFSSPLRAKDFGVPTTPEVRVVLPSHDEAIAEGYDSEGCRAPWLTRKELDFDGLELSEVPLPIVPPAVLPEMPPLENVAEKTCTLAVGKMGVVELRTELKKRGIKITGLKKAELVAKLNDAIEKNVPLVEELPQKEAENLAGDVFSPRAYWEELPCEGEFIDENIPNGFRAPTVPLGENAAVRKRNYKQKFNRMVFTGIAEFPKRTRNKSISRKKDGSIIFEKRAHTETEVKMSFVRAHNLNVDSSPVHWFQAFLPISNNEKGVTTYSMQNALMWTNMRATMEAAGIGGKYSDFKSFTLPELMQHIGLYLLQALSPCPQIEMKFYSQSADPVNGNDFVSTSFGGKPSISQRRHRHFKAFFASNNPTIPVPDRNIAPNWKIHPFLKHISSVSQEAVFLGRNLSCDEQTIGFQGHHKDKQRITYKAEGDGFLTDALCSDGYTYAFHFRHQDSSEKIKETFKCSPLHARVIGLISQLPHKYYTLGMDNLYNSAKLCRLCYSLPQKVMVHGVTRPSGRGIPSIVKQEEVTKKADLEKVRHTIKAAVLKNDDVVTDLVSVSCYDTKPVYMLSNACENISWVKKERDVFDSTKNKKFKLPFYRLNLIDFYNHNMGNVDLADQLRNHYRYDALWHRNRKWWWAIWWWGFQVLLTNSYVLYQKYHLMIDSKAAVSHYDYIKEIALAWVNQELYWPKRIAQKKRKAQGDIDNGKRKTRPTVRILETGSVSTASTCSKAPNVTNETLHPSGSLRNRLNTSVQHLPEKPSTKRPICQLHRWARGRGVNEVRGGILKCSVCRIHLCIACYKLFHTEASIVERKDEIAAIGAG